MKISRALAIDLVDCGRLLLNNFIKHFCSCRRMYCFYVLQTISVCSTLNIYSVNLEMLVICN